MLDVANGDAIAEIDVGIEPEGMAVSPDGTIAVVTSETTNMVHWINTDEQQIFHNTLVAQRPRHAEFSESGDRLWVSSEIGGTIAVIDTATQEVLHEMRMQVPGISDDLVQPVGIRLTSDGTKAFVALGPSNHVAVVDQQTYEVLEYILVGRRVWHLEFDEGDKHIYSTNGVSGDVTVIDVDKMQPIKTIKVGRFPWGAAFRPG